MPIFDPTGLSFGSQLVNTTSAAQTFSLTNDTGADIALAATGYTFTPAAVPAGQTVQVSVTFTPSAAVSYDSTVSAQAATLSLTGTGVLYDEADMSGTSDIWARISVPNTPKGYLRLGDTTTNADALEFSPGNYQSTATAIYTLTGTSSFKGSFLFTDTNIVTAAELDRFDYVGQNAHRGIVGDRRVDVGTDTTSTTETASSESADTRPLSAYTPSNETFANFDLPAWVAGTGPTGTYTPMSYVDNVEVRGSRMLKVHNLLTEYVRGDRASYVRGDEYHHVEGSYKLVIEGSDDETTIGDKTTTIFGNRTETIGSDSNKRIKTTTVFGKRTSTVYGTKTSTVNGTRTSEVHGVRTKLRLGFAVSVVLGFRFNVDLGARFVFIFGPYVRLFTSRVTVFFFKADFTSLKIDIYGTKVGSYNQLRWGSFLAGVLQHSVMGLNFLGLKISTAHVAGDAAQGRVDMYGTFHAHVPG